MTAAISLAGVGTSLGSMFLCDNADTPESTSWTPTGWRYEAGSLCLPSERVDQPGGESKISVSAMANASGGFRRANVAFMNRFTLASERDEQDATSVPAISEIPLVSVAQAGRSEPFGDIMSLLLDGVDGTLFHGWTDASSMEDVPSDRLNPDVSLSIKRMASTLTNESITVGVIPEPAAVSLVLGFGSALLFLRRRFAKK